MTKLCPRGKAAAKRKFKVYPSAYANAYASRICAGKIKDPSGVKRKDFRGPKKAMGGRIMKAGGGLMEATARLKRQGLRRGGPNPNQDRTIPGGEQRKGVKGKSATELQMERNQKIKNRRQPNRNIPKGKTIMGPVPVPAEKRKKITEFRKTGGRIGLRRGGGVCLRGMNKDAVGKNS